MDRFTLVIPVDLGALQELRIWQDRPGPESAWHLKLIEIQDMATKQVSIDGGPVLNLMQVCVFPLLALIVSKELSYRGLMDKDCFLSRCSISFMMSGLKAAKNGT